MKYIYYCTQYVPKGKNRRHISSISIKVFNNTERHFYWDNLNEINNWLLLWNGYGDISRAMHGIRLKSPLYFQGLLYYRGKNSTNGTHTSKN